MSHIIKLVQQLGREWATPRQAVHRGALCPFLLMCAFDPPLAHVDTLVELKPSASSDLREFWSIAQSADLFKDTKYGQWGIRIVSPVEALTESQRQLRERGNDFKASDLVIGRFLGDAELLVMRCAKGEPDFGSVLVALALDGRVDWPCAAPSFCEFLDKLILAQGDKYWELGKRGAL